MRWRSFCVVNSNYSIKISLFLNGGNKTAKYFYFRNRFEKTLVMGKGDDGDLRKEVEMNEHQITTEELARQYDLNLSTGLSNAEVKKVKQLLNS